jgi:membrane protease YdiL (CAAX protease family)
VSGRAPGRLAREAAEVLAVPLAVYAALVPIALFQPRMPGTPSVLFALFTGTAIFGLGAALVLRLRGVPLRAAVGWGAPTPRAARLALLSVLLAVAAVVVKFWFHRLSGVSPARNGPFIAMILATRGALGLMLPLWFAHAFGEELFFRGLLHRWLASWTTTPAAAALGAAAFCVMHVPQSLEHAVVLVFVSLACTSLYDRLGSLAYPVAFHGAVNAVFNATVYWREVLGRRVFLEPLTLVLLGCLAAWLASGRPARRRA